MVREAVPPDLLPEVGELFSQIGRARPQQPHWYLPSLGVDPAHQGQGVGGALLRAALERCDREGAASYLESSSPRNVPLYERHGFEVQGEIRYGSSPPVIPMLRSART